MTGPLQSPMLFKLMDKYSPTLMLLIYCCFYIVGYIQRFKTLLVIDNPILDWLLTETALLGNSLLPFIIGAYFFKYNLVSRVRHSLESKFKQFYINFFMIISIISMFIAKTYVPTLFVAIATGIGLIICYLLIDKPVFIKKSFVTWECTLLTYGLPTCLFILALIVLESMSI